MANLKKKILNKAGLTLLEIVIAVGILAVTLSGTMMILVRISNQGSSIEARSLAVQYAQEAMDAVKNYRDNNYCTFFSMNNGNYSVSKVGDNWTMNTSATWVDVFTAGSSEQLGTNMRRSIQVSNIPGQIAQRVVITMRWQTKNSLQQDYVASTEMYKWKY